jgi:hypothetical protein
MGALANSASLATSEEFRGLVRAASVYQATVVITEDSSTDSHDTRLALASEALVNPEVVLDRLVAVLASTPDIAAISGEASDIPDEMIIGRVAEAWTILSMMYFAPPVV